MTRMTCEKKSSRCWGTCKVATFARVSLIGTPLWNRIKRSGPAGCLRVPFPVVSTSTTQNTVHDNRKIAQIVLIADRDPFRTSSLSFPRVDQQPSSSRSFPLLFTDRPGYTVAFEFASDLVTWTC